MYNHTYATAERVVIDLRLSESPLGPSPHVVHAIIRAAEKSHFYPHEEKELIECIAQYHHIDPSTILLGAGANQLLEEYLKIFALGKSIVVPAATFPESVACMATLRGSVKRVALCDNFSIDLETLLHACTLDTGFIHLCNPNNPTGIWTSIKDLVRLAECSPVPILISEAGADFVGRTMVHPSLHSNLIIVRSFSKAYGLAGLRIGYSISSPQIVKTMKSHLQSYRMSSVSIVAAMAALQDQDHLQKTIAYALQEKAWLMREMGALDFTVVSSDGQSFIAKVPEAFVNAGHFCAVAERHGVGVVNCALYPGFEQYIRVCPQRHEVNEQFVLVLKTIIKGE